MYRAIPLPLALQHDFKKAESFDVIVFLQKVQVGKIKENKQLMQFTFRVP
jgi:hypothetical protein